MTNRTKLKKKECPKTQLSAANILCAALMGTFLFALLRMAGFGLWSAAAIGGMCSAGFGIYLYCRCFGDPFEDSQQH